MYLISRNIDSYLLLCYNTTKKRFTYPYNSKETLYEQRKLFWRWITQLYRTLDCRFFHHRLNSRNCHTLGRLFYARLESPTYWHRWSTFILWWNWHPVIWKLDQMVLTDDYHSWNLFILVKNKNRTMDYQAYPSYVKSAVYRPHFFYSS